ncbi:MAG TPA: DoxX family protein, partial [Saprospiraceae bacterium]|nr:DoxX family protein [Saprospiraceae bacterium]
FCGVWFIFSGLGKAVDPLGTAYKMEDYFVQFQATFEGLNNAFAGLAPLFPWLTGYANGFSIFMIVLEIVLGVMLIVGFQRRLTAWLFFLIVVFFTVLTGFTYLTGYVPTEANFFDFAKWGPYVKSQMRVTDCGCFGDFIKLDPRISFFKDLGLLIPSFLFLFRHKWMHQLWTTRLRRWVVYGTTALTLLLCLRNTYWDLPMVDFRPFKVGTNVRELKAFEGSAKQDILGWLLVNDSTGQVATYMEPEPNKYTYIQTYPKSAGWRVKEQIKNDLYVLKDGQRIPVTKTKVSEFAVERSENGENVEATDDILEEKGYSLMIVAYHLEGSKQTETIMVADTTWVLDTVRVSADSMHLLRRMASVE